MKSQLKRSPHRSRLASRSCSRFSPTSSIPASASAPMSASRTYLVAARISTSGPASRRMRSRLACTRSTSRPVTGSTIGWLRLHPCRHPRQPGLAASALPVPAMGVEELGVAAGAQIGGLDFGDSGAGEQGAGDRGQIEHPSLRDAVEILELREHLL